MREKLLILDLDETLIHSETFPGSDYLDEGTYDFSFAIDSGAWSSSSHHYYTRKRPFLDEFLEYAFSNFKVGVWTAADMDYASIILNRCNIPLSKLEFIWSKESCTIRRNIDTGDNYGVKNLNKVRKTFKWDLKDVLIVDDIAETAVNNYGNLIKIKSFEYQSNDTELLKLMSYLEKIKNENDFRRIEKRGWCN
jgi:RNA polymerase II subunit A small phosphatase-like protein